LLLRNLPPGVTAPPSTIAANQTAVEVDLTAAPTATVGNRPGVNILGTATTAANQQNASPAFAVNVVKK
jgi:hypothetical protein